VGELCPARIEVAVSTDSDNDQHYTLQVVGADGKRKITSAIHDETDVVEIAQWLSARTGFPLHLPHQLQPPAASR
jgi:hypothetical protein